MDMKDVLAEIIPFNKLYASKAIMKAGQLSPVAKRYIAVHFELVMRHLPKDTKLTTEQEIETQLIKAMGFEQMPEAMLPVASHVHTLFTLRASKVD